MTLRDHSNCGDECYRCRILSVGIASSAMPTRSTAASQKEFADATNRDLPAYKRLRDSGLQPKATSGAAYIESRATERFEVETGQICPDPKLRRRYQQAFDEVSA